MPSRRPARTTAVAAPVPQDAMTWPRHAFDVTCTRCPRLASHLEGMRTAHPEYHNAPVPPFGDPRAQLLVVGLAPGAHGANATGRPFTGDHAGLLLYGALFRAGLASAPVPVARGDGLTLRNCRITNAVKCLPPGNKPTTAEADTCNAYLVAELAASHDARVVLALGAIAHRAVLKAEGCRAGEWRFAHGSVHRLPTGRVLVDSYHCSRYNTQTRRLTQEMFDSVVEHARDLAQGFDSE